MEGAFDWMRLLRGSGELCCRALLDVCDGDEVVRSA